MSRSASCKACSAPLIWALTPGGKRAPIDRDASGEGNVLLLSPTGLPTALAVTLSGDALEAARSSPVSLRLNHFVTCVNREEFKEKKE